MLGLRVHSASGGSGSGSGSGSDDDGSGSVVGGGDGSDEEKCEATVTGGSFATLHVTTKPESGKGKGKKRGLATLEVILRGRDGGERYRHRIDPNTCRAL